MLYPLYVHHDEGSAYGGSFPDIPGCFTAADELAELPLMAQEAVEVFFEGESCEISPPTPIDHWKDDPDYQGGFWLLVDIDFDRVNSKPRRLNISLPSNLVKRIDAFAKARGSTRSSFLAEAARAAMAAAEPRRG